MAKIRENTEFNKKRDQKDLQAFKNGLLSPNAGARDRLKTVNLLKVGDQPTELLD